MCLENVDLQIISCILNFDEALKCLTALRCNAGEIAPILYLASQTKYSMCRYRMFIKYCVFPSNVIIFLNSASSAAPLVFALPLTKRGNQARPESGI